jgi:anti-sigma B factor antagonist
MADTLELQVRRAGEIGIVEVRGYINNTGGEQVANACETLIAEGVRRFALNLGGSSLVNSVGISFLIEIIEKVRELGGRVAFCQVSRTIAKTFQIMGLLQLASLHQTEQEAVQALRSG